METRDWGLGIGDWGETMTMVGSMVYNEALKMGIARQLYQLQEVDLELESTEQAVKQITRQLNESEALTGARNKLAAERQHLEELRKQQRSAEHEADDLTAKLKRIEEELYSGRIRNPKELANLQHEAETMKGQRGQFESRVLEIMEQADQTTKKVSDSESKLGAVEAAWNQQHQHLSADLERLKAVLVDVTQRSHQVASGIEATALDVYLGLRKARGTAVVKVERGICGGCRVALPSSETQRTRSGELVRCGSCGRILYLA